MEVDFTFKPELMLDQQELSELVAIYGQPGFKVINKIHRTCVDWFVKQLINAPATDKEEVLVRHLQSQVAAQLYTLLLDSINNMVSEHIHSQPSAKPVEAAQGLDFGDETDQWEDSLI